MAFVSKKEREINVSKNETRNIGPGVYYENESNNEEQQNFYPFNSQVSRVTLEIPYEHKLRNIGPGAYESSSSFLKKSFSTRSLDNNGNTIDKSLFDLLEKTKILQRKDHARMIKDSFLIKKIQPKIFSCKNNEAKQKKHFKIYDTTNTSNRVLSIPLKDSFGYIFDEHNNPILAENPFKNSRNGVDSNPEDKINKKLRGIDWSKMSISKNSNNTSVNNSCILPISQESTKANYSTKDKPSKRSHSQLFLLHRKEKKKMPIEDKLVQDILSLPPGPGYYWDEEYNPFIKKNNTNLKGFGLEEKKKNKLSDSQDNLVGPGSYYKTRYIPKIVNAYPFNSNDKRLPDTISQDLNPYLGPGSYNVRKDLNVIKPSSIYSGSLNRRFNYYIKQENNYPGPGEYIDFPSWGKKESIQPESVKNKQNVNPPSIIIPSVGQYNPDIVHSIEYKNKSSENKLQSFIAPFNSGTERFIQSNSTNDMLGPGCYYQDKKSSPKSKKLPQVNTSLNKTTIKDGGLGPGSYDEFNYYMWNKRSYNVNFI